MQSTDKPPCALPAPPCSRRHKSPSSLPAVSSPSRRRRRDAVLRSGANERPGAPRLPALQRLSLQSREPGAWNGLTPSAHVSLFPSGVCVRLGLLSQENPCGLLLAFPLSSLYSASFLCPHCQLCSLLSRTMQFPRNGFLRPIHQDAVFLCLSLPVALPF